MVMSLFFLIFFCLGGPLLGFCLSGIIGITKAILLAICGILLGLCLFFGMRKREQEALEDQEETDEAETEQEGDATNVTDDQEDQEYTEYYVPPRNQKMKEERPRMQIPPVVKAVLIWTIFYCALILVSAFGDMSSSFYIFFKIVSLIHFAFLAILFFSRGRIVPILIGFFNAAIAVFFINSFATWYASDFWRVFDLILVVVVVVEFFLPMMLGKHNLD
jgi:hypothetical protein